MKIYNEIKSLIYLFKKIYDKVFYTFALLKNLYVSDKVKSRVLDLQFKVNYKKTPHDFNQLFEIPINITNFDVDTFYYVGASAGVLPITLAIQLRAKELTVFEFDPESVRFLRENCENHSHFFESINIIQACCSDHQSLMQIRSLTPSNGSMSMRVASDVSENLPTNVKFHVPSVNLYEYMADKSNFHKIALCLNANGSEVDILNQIYNFRLEFDLIVFHEFTNMFGSKEINEVLDKLTSLGYEYRLEGRFYFLTKGTTN